MLVPNAPYPNYERSVWTAQFTQLFPLYSTINTIIKDICYSHQLDCFQNSRNGRKVVNVELQPAQSTARRFWLLSRIWIRIAIGIDRDHCFRHHERCVAGRPSLIVTKANKSLFYSNHPLISRIIDFRKLPNRYNHFVHDQPQNNQLHGFNSTLCSTS